MVLALPRGWVKSCVQVRNPEPDRSRRSTSNCCLRRVSGIERVGPYKEKCFLVQPLMRQLLAEGKLTGAAAELMKPFPAEMLYDTQSDPYEIQNLAESDRLEHQLALARLRAALDTWIVETDDRGERPEPAEVVAPFEKEMHDWFGTPAWHERE